MIEYKLCRSDGIGRRDGFKIHCWRQRAGSSPAFGTKGILNFYLRFFLFIKNPTFKFCKVGFIFVLQKIIENLILLLRYSIKRIEISFIIHQFIKCSTFYNASIF